MSEGTKYDKGKTRMDLLPHNALKEIAEVYTFGADKYGDYNWAQGMKWSRLYSALQRHIQAFWRGEDVDIESQTKHLAHAGCCLTMLLEYYKIHPQGDDRPHTQYNTPKIGLDIDGVLANFNSHIFKFSGKEHKEVTHWNDPTIRELFEKVKHNSEFWSTIPALINPSDIPFEPVAYVTARSIDQKITQAWLDNNNFPKAPLYCVGTDESKLEIIKNLDIDIFLDDKFETFIELNRNGICCFLMNASYNKKYNVGYKRIYNLKELI